MLKKPSNKTLAVIAITLTMLIWGSAIVISKSVVEEVGPLVLATIRFAIAAAIFTPYGLRKFPLRQLPLKPLFISSFFGITVFYALLNIGLLFSTAASAGLIQGAAPIITLLLSVMVLRENLNIPKLSGVILSVSGIFIIVLVSEGSQNGTQSIIGHLFIIGSTVAWAIYVITSKSLVSNYPQQVVTACHIFFGFIFLIPFGVFESIYFSYNPVSAGNILAIVFLALTSSGIAYFFWNFSVKHLSATRAGAFINLCPLVTLITAVIFLDETIGPIIIIGAALIISGLYLTGLPGRTILTR